MKKIISALLSLLILLSALGAVSVSAEEPSGSEILFDLSDITSDPSDAVHITQPDGTAFPGTADASVSMNDGKLLLTADTTASGNFTLFNIPDHAISEETYTLIMKAVIVSADGTIFSEFATSKPVAEVGFRVTGASWEYGWDNGTAVRFLRRSDGKIGAQGLNRNDITKVTNKDRNSAQTSLAAGTDFDDSDTRSVSFTAAIAVGKTEVVFFLNGENIWSVPVESYVTGGYPSVGVYQNTILEVEELKVIAGTAGFLEEEVTPDDPTTPDDPVEPVNNDPVYYPAGTVILNEEILKKNLDQFRLIGQNGSRVNSAKVVWNDETGRLQLTSDTSVNTHFFFQWIPTGLDYFTMSADFYLTRNDFGNNVLVQMGYRNPEENWGQGNFIQFYLYNDGTTKDKAQMVDKGPDGNTISSALTFDKSLLGEDGTGKITLRIVVDDKIANYYINDTFIHAMKVSKMQFSYGVPFIVCRNNITVEVDNLMIWSGVGEPDASRTVENTQPCETKDLPVEETSEVVTTGAAPVTTDRPGSGTENAPVDSTAPVSGTPETTGNKDADPPKSGCASALGGVFAVLATVGCAPIALCRKRKH